MITSRLSVTPRISETNQMGFIAEASFPRWLDLGRAVLLREQGLDYRQFELLGYWVPVLEIGLTFHRPAYYGDTLDIITVVRSRPTFRIRLDYEVRREASLLATGYSVHAFVNREQRPVRPPPAFMARLEEVFPRNKSA
jgi:acyl-CoA thioester hydrolase